MQRAFSLLTLKSVDEDQRVIVGMATTPSADRLGDIVEPGGAVFQLPIPLLWQHDARQPIGEVFAATVLADGIEVHARVAKIDEPGTLKNRLDEAWQSIKARLVRGLSIGFSSIEEARIKDSYSFHYLKWLWLELSAVTIPANAEASIQLVKQYDIGRAAPGAIAVVDPQPSSGVSDTHRVVALTRRDARTMKTYAEKVAAFTAEKATKVAKMNELAAAENGSTMDAAQQEEFDTLVKEVAAIDGHLARLETVNKMNLSTATPVTATTEKDGQEQRGPVPVIRVKSNLPPDLEFSRMVLCKAASFLECSKGNFVSPLQIAKARYPDDERIHQYLIAKTAVAGGTTTDANTHAALLAQAQVLESAFLEYLRPRTIIGKFGQNGIPALRRVPFNVKIQSQTTGASASWVGEGKPKPVTKFQTASTTLLFTKIAAIAVITDELARFSFPGAEGVVRDELSRAVIERMDTDFVDPAKAVSSGVNPASITNGLVALSTAGTSAANVLTDLQALINPFILNNYDVSDLVLIMPNSLALVLSLMENSLGQPAFAGIGINGGTLRGIPVITSQYAASGASYGNMVIAVSAGNIALADDGKVTVDASREASIEMSDAPGSDATAGTGASMVSMFQTNSIALRAEREINWKKLRSTAAVFMDDVNWGSIGSPF